jgi:hypothetical protein
VFREVEKGRLAPSALLSGSHVGRAEGQVVFGQKTVAYKGAITRLASKQRSGLLVNGLVLAQMHKVVRSVVARVASVFTFLRYWVRSTYVSSKNAVRSSSVLTAGTLEGASNNTARTHT